MGTKQFNNYEDLITFTRASGGHALRPVSYGTELVTNGTFDSDTSNWTAVGGASQTVLSIDSQRLKVTTVSTVVNAYGSQELTLTAGKVYRITGNTTAGTYDHGVAVGLTAGATNVAWTGYQSVDQTVDMVFVATQAENYISLYARTSSGGEYAFFDNISVKEVSFDESDGTLTLFEHPDSVPRVEYDSDGNRLGLLVEEARTNLTTISEPTASELSNSSNVSDGDFNNSLGLSNGIKFDDNSAARYAYRDATVASGQDYTFSVFVKMDDSSTPDVGTSTTSGDFGLVVGSSLVTSGSDISITAMSDNVFRVSGTRTTTSTANKHGVIKYTGQSTKGFTVTGFQIEEGSFGTSYIKTTGSTATRSADVASIPVADFGYNQSAGTVVADYYAFAGQGSTTRIAALNDGSTSNSIQMALLDAGTTYHEVRSGGSAFVTTVISGAITDNALTKTALANSLNDYAGVTNGGTVGTDTSGAMPVGITTLNIGSHYSGNFPFNGHIKSLKYYPRRLTNAQLVDLTS